MTPSNDSSSPSLAGGPASLPDEYTVDGIKKGKAMLNVKHGDDCGYCGECFCRRGIVDFSHSSFALLIFCRSSNPSPFIIILFLPFSPLNPPRFPLFTHVPLPVAQPNALGIAYKKDIRPNLNSTPPLPIRPSPPSPPREQQQAVRQTPNTGVLNILSSFRLTVPRRWRSGLPTHYWWWTWTRARY
jgi:hypothetical protein